MGTGKPQKDFFGVYFKQRNNSKQRFPDYSIKLYYTHETFVTNSGHPLLLNDLSVD